MLLSNNTGEGPQPVTETYGDYRAVDGVVLPFKTVPYCGDTGITIARLKDVMFDVETPDSRRRRS
jgi:hypothetical protein